MEHNGVGFVIEKEPDDPGYLAYCPSLPGCFGAGLTVEEAEWSIRAAIDQHVDSMREDGEQMLAGGSKAPASMPPPPRLREAAEERVFEPIRRSDRRRDAGPFTKVLMVLFLGAFGGGFGLPLLSADVSSPQIIIWKVGVPAAIGVIAGIVIVSKWRKD